MSYTPTNWQAGDTVTSAKLNKMEQGIAASGGGSNIVFVEVDDNGALSLTLREILENFQNKKLMFIIDYYNSFGMLNIITAADVEGVRVINFLRYEESIFFAETLDDYPILNEEYRHGFGLPYVNQEDEGKILKVNDLGDWAAENASSPNDYPQVEQQEYSGGGH